MITYTRLRGSDATTQVLDDPVPEFRLAITACYELVFTI